MGFLFKVFQQAFKIFDHIFQLVDSFFLELGNK